MSGPSTYLYVDVECRYAPRKGLTLRKQTLRQYMAQTEITYLCYAIDDEPPVGVAWPAHDTGFVAELQEAMTTPGLCLVAHNWSFDARVIHHMLGCAYPDFGHDTLDLAHMAWPNQPGGYKLENLGMLPWIGREKVEIDLTEGKHTAEELLAYCLEDVEIMRLVHQAALARLPDRELRIEESTTRFRELTFIVDNEKVLKAIETFDAEALQATAEAMSVLGKSGAQAFGWNLDGGIKSVKPLTLRQLLLDELAFDTPTTSLKKISPAKLGRNKEASELLHATSRANRFLSHRRRMHVFSGADEVDAELASGRAHTFRNSSPSAGKGLNLLNLPKHDKQVALPIRQSYKLPKDLCMVRADAANLEYRMNGLVTGCQHCLDLFERDPFADPYAAFWAAATGQTITKSNPIRQVAKKAVLGLGYLMGANKWMTELLIELAKPYCEITVENLAEVIQEQGWTYRVLPAYVKSHATKIGAPREVAIVAYHTWVKFHAVHPEFKAFAEWLHSTLLRMISAPDPEAVLAKALRSNRAPDQKWFGLELDDGLEGISVRARCGLWTNTVAWRDLGNRDTPFGWGMTSVQAGNKGFRMVTKNILIENVIQSAGRNGIAAAKLALADDYPYIGDVHDEILLIVPRTREDVLRARDDLIRVAGPGNGLGYGWAMMIDPSDISVTESWYEDDMDKLADNWWGRLEAGDESVLETLW